MPEDKNGAVPPAPQANDKAYPLGIVSTLGSDVSSGERVVSDGEPPPLPVNAQLKWVGQPVPRIDGRLKVTGAAKYTADVHPPGMLFARMLISPYPHAKIKSIDTSAAEKAPGVKAVHVVEKVLGVAEEKLGPGEEKPKYPVVRFAGQPIAAVAAVTQYDADEAARLIKVEYEQLPFVVDVEKAREKDAPQVFSAPAEQGGSAGGGGGPKNVKQEGNVRGPAVGGGKKPEEMADAFKDAEVVLETEYKTQVQTHSALETHGVVADFKPDMLTVWASTQGTGSVRDELNDIFNIPKSKIRVITEYMGGGFGAKFGAGNWGVIATHLSKKAGAPVRLMCDRKDEHLGTGNRPSSNQKYKIGAKKDGTLVAMHLVSYGTAGVGTGAGASGPTQNMYDCPAICTEDSDVFINAGPAAAFRAPGHPQACFGLEQAIDELAEKLTIDPIALREKIDPSDARKVERKIGAEKIGWSNRKPAGSDAGPVKRGIGFAQAIWYRFASVRDSHCEVRILHDGSVEFLSSVQDIGGGIRGVLAQTVAEELGLKPTDITIKIGDTNYPGGPASGGSVTTNSITPVARKAAWQVGRQLCQQVAPKLGVQPDELTLSDGQIVSKLDPTKKMTFRKAAGMIDGEQIAVRADRAEDYKDPEPPSGQRPKRGKGSGGLGGVQFAQVSVDTETGVVKVEKVVAVHDCGRPMNPLTLKSQINGGVIQGLSYALYENRILDRNTGVMVNPNLEQYKIAGSKEMPEIEPIVIEQYWGRSATDAAGIGEPSTVPTAGAIANAIYNAIGVRIRQMPITPAVVLAALAEKNGNEKKGA